MAVAIGYVSVASTLANAIVRANPVLAHSLSPYDGAIAAELAATEMTASPASTPESRPAYLAREALREDPTAVKALNVLGLQAQLLEETNRARTIFAYSLALSRRNLQSHFWAIEDAVSRGDVQGALKQYDTALRTSRRAPDVLFPTLSGALSEPKVRQGIIDILLTKPVWGDRFVRYVSQGEIDPIGSVAFFRNAEAAGLKIVDGDRTRLINVLVRRGEVDAAWSYYRTFREANRLSSRNAKFIRTVQSPAYFDWVVQNTTGMSVSIHAEPSGGVAEFSIAPSVGGKMIEQWQMLLPGTYRFESTVEELDQPGRSLPYWSLTCRDGRSLGNIPVPTAKSEAVSFSGQFVVPSDCSPQILALIARPSDDISGVYGRVRSAVLKKRQGGD
ncbi:hypothetical protein [Tsuneonella suprasediminis]|uniref:tetratricopeptide repeat protein n=1 Tax=Tsuneonella suprasediminis TaxID=2306996 RepID=UPI002F95FAA4